MSLIQQLGLEDGFFNQINFMLIRKMEKLRIPKWEVFIFPSRTHTHSCPLKPAFSGPRTVLASVKPPQACHGKGTAINLTDIIQSDGWGGDKTASVCMCGWMCVRVVQRNYHLLQRPTRGPCNVNCTLNTHRIHSLVPKSSLWDSQSDCLFRLAHCRSDIRHGNFRWC